jgi:hypothetical protein
MGTPAYAVRKTMGILILPLFDAGPAFPRNKYYNAESGERC